MNAASKPTTVLIPDVAIFRGDLHDPVPVAQDKPNEKVFKLWGGFPKEKADEIAKQVLAVAGKDSFAGHTSKPFRDGAAVKEDGSRRYGEYADGRVVFNAKTKFPPKVLYGKEKKELLREHVYPGLIGAALVRPFFFNRNGNTGISLQLIGFWATAKGPKLDIGSVDANEEFEHASTSLTFGDLADLDEPLF